MKTSSMVRRPAAWAASLVAAGLVAACGGGGSGSSDTPVAPSGNPTVRATADTLVVAAGANAQLLANDTLGSAAAAVGSAADAVRFSVVGSVPAGLSVADGVVSVAADAAPGSYSFDYRICQATVDSNCATATATITVPAPALVVADDSFNLLPGTSGDLLANDRLGAAPATATTVSVSPASAMPGGLSLSGAGVIAVASGTAPGSYTLAYTACQVAAPTNCATAQASITVPAVGTLTGRAVDGSTGEGVANITVSAAGIVTTTGADGTFSIPNLGTASRVSVVFDSPNHAEMARVASVNVGSTTDVQARLTRLAGIVTVDAATGGAATLTGSTARVELPAAGLVRADGSSVSGSVNVALTPISVGNDTSVMPGDFQTETATGLQPIESFGALNVRLTDTAGQPLNLASGQSATIRIPVSSRTGTPPATIPLFYFNNATGNWVEEGSATLVGSGTSAYYQGTVRHFSTWNADQVYNTVRVTGCVADAEGNRIAGARISADGVDYSGASSATTDAAGSFSIPIRRGSIATLSGQSGTRFTNTQSVGAYTADTALGNCLVLGQTGTSLTMKLTWGLTPRDLDSHLWTPSGAHVYYSSRGSLSAAPYANLDVDDTSSYGPEVVTIQRLMVGTYSYMVYNYSGYGAGPITTSGARVELNLPGRTVELFLPPATGENASNRYWNLFSLTVDAACNITVTRNNVFQSAGGSTTSATPTYCTAPAN